VPPTSTPTLVSTVVGIQATPTLFVGELPETGEGAPAEGRSPRRGLILLLTGLGAGALILAVRSRVRQR
jgi:hypothetical protein